MHRYIAILRGINVGGKRRILMADLRKMMEGLNFVNITTYIQSGNIIFDATKEIEHGALAKQLQSEILKHFGHEVPVIVLNPKDLENAVQQNPFKATGEGESLHLTFLSEVPNEKDVDAISDGDYRGDQFAVEGRNVFLLCQGKYHKSKLTNGFFEKKLKVTATTRNWKTVLKLVELGK